MEIKPIHTDEDYEAALARIDEIWDSQGGSPESDELEILSTLVESYEEEHYPMASPDPIEAIKVRMEDLGLTRKDLEPYLGTRARVSEVLNRRRPLTLPMIRSLTRVLGIPGDVLLQSYPLEKKPRSKPDSSRKAACVA